MLWFNAGLGVSSPRAVHAERHQGDCAGSFGDVDSPDVGDEPGDAG